MSHYPCTHPALAIMHKIGIISDTHGLVRPQALELLTGVELIVHAGDIGKPEVLEQLQSLAPVIAVRGNVDKGSWADPLAETETFSVAGKQFLVIHNIAELDPAVAGENDAIIFGHSHKPCNEVRDSVLYFNPGSAGPRRFKLPIALGILSVTSNEVEGKVLEITL